MFTCRWVSTAVALLLGCTVALASSTSTISVSASPNPATYGHAVTLQAAVTAGTTGKVTFYDGATVLGIAPVSGGQAVFTTSMLQSGTRSLRAHYSGDATYAASDSTVVSQTVTALPSLGLKLPISTPLTKVPYSAATGDLNNDGATDLVLPNYANGVISVVLGNGDGTFRTAVDYAVSPGPLYAVVCDLNGDGKNDIAVTTSAGVNVLIGNGDGTFQPAVNYPSAGYCIGIVAADFNGDGKVDVAVVYGATVRVLLGNGDGSLSTAVAYPLAGSAYSIGVGDFNGDGKTDIVVASSNSLSFLAGNGDGTLRARVDYPVATYYPRIAVADFNGDGKLDILLASNSAPLTMLIGNGDGVFLPAQTFAVYPYSPVLALGDMNGDGTLDLVYRSGYSAISVLPANGDGTFGTAVSYTSANGIYAGDLIAGNFTGKGVVDVLAVDTGYGGLTLLGGGATPDLAIVSSHRTDFIRGQSGAAYLLKVSNVGGIPTAGSIAVVDTLPVGLTATSIAGAGWNCVLPTLTCMRSDSAAPGASLPTIIVTVNVAANAPTNVTNVAIVSGGNDGDSSNNTASDPTINRQLPSVTFTAGPASAILGHAVTMTATVTSGASGRVSFYDGTAIIGTAGLTSGVAVLSTSSLPVGSHSLRAQYDGDNAYGPAASTTIILTVAAAASGGFRSTTSFGAGTNPGMMVTADFNGDGKPDLATSQNAYDSNSGTYINSVTVWLSRGDGTFQPAIKTNLATAASNMVAGDFNLDGKIDLFVSNGSGVYRVLAGNGDGTFQVGPSTQTNLPGTVAGCVSADFDGDGRPDAAISSNGIVAVLIGNGDGTFQDPVLTTGTFTGSSLVAADFNRDGKADLAVATLGGFTVLLGNGDGTFQTGNSIGNSVNASPVMAVGDLNADGKPDVVYLLSYGTVYVALGTGDGNFQTPVSYSTWSGASGLTLGDVNGDGLLDVVTSPYGSQTQGAILLGNGDGTLRSPVSYRVTSSNSSGVVAADFDGDGKTDLAISNDLAGGISIVLGGGSAGAAITMSHTGRFVPGQTGAVYTISVSNPTFSAISGTIAVHLTPPGVFTITALSGTGWNCTLLTLQCIRVDGLVTGLSFPDITATITVSASPAPYTVTNAASVTSSGGTNSASDPTAIAKASSIGLIAPSAGTFGRSLTMIATVSNGASGSVAFTDNAALLGSVPLAGGQASFSTRLLGTGTHLLRAIYSGDADSASSRSNGTSVFVYNNQSNGFGPVANYVAGNAPVAIASADFNRDGKTDLVVVNRDSNSVSVLLGRGDGTFQANVDYAVGRSPISVAVADFNGDGYPDLAVANQGDSTVSVLLGTAAGIFQAAVAYPLSSQPYQLIAGDFNGDGIADLAVACSSNGVSILLGNGDGTFVPKVQSVASGGYGPIAAGDFNGDGILDIVANSYVKLGNGDGTFHDGVSFAALIINGLAVADLNGDGKLDIVIAEIDGVYVALGNGDGTFQTPAAIGPRSYSYTSIVVTDFNGDGKPDILAANSSQGVSVFMGNGNGSFQAAVDFAGAYGAQTLVVGEFNGDTKVDVAIANSSYNNISVLLGTLSPSLSVAVSHTGNFTAGQIGATYKIVVTNRGPGVTSGTVTVRDTLPSVFTATAISGTGWNCDLYTLTCTRSDSLDPGAIDPGASYPPITVTVNVSPTATGAALNLHTR